MWYCWCVLCVIEVRAHIRILDTNATIEHQRTHWIPLDTNGATVCVYRCLCVSVCNLQWVGRTYKMDSLVPNSLKLPLALWARRFSTKCPQVIALKPQVFAPQERESLGRSTTPHRSYIEPGFRTVAHAPKHTLRNHAPPSAETNH